MRKQVYKWLQQADPPTFSPYSVRLEARGGIEPPNRGFAVPGLTTWLPRRVRNPENSRKSGDGKKKARRERRAFQKNGRFPGSELDARRDEHLVDHVDDTVARLDVRLDHGRFVDLDRPVIDGDVNRGAFQCVDGTGGHGGGGDFHRQHVVGEDFYQDLFVAGLEKHFEQSVGERFEGFVGRCEDRDVFGGLERVGQTGRLDGRHQCGELIRGHRGFDDIIADRGGGFLAHVSAAAARAASVGGRTGREERENEECDFLFHDLVFG